MTVFLLPEGPQHLDMMKICKEKGLLDAICRASNNSTSELESYHAALNRNAPKMESFGQSSMISRYAMYSRIQILADIIFY